MNDSPKPARAYPDWHRLVPGRFREEVYIPGGDWVFCYNIDWESFLIYGIILHNKDYLIEGGMPDWFRAYVERREILPFDCAGQDVTLVFHKAGWVRNTMTFHLTDNCTEKGTIYNTTSRIEPEAGFISGDPAPGRAACPQTTWEPYVLGRMERLRYGTDWNPSRA